MQDRNLRIDKVMELTGLSRTTIWRLESKGMFPRRHKITSKIIGWYEAEVIQWIKAEQESPQQSLEL